MLSDDKALEQLRRSIKEVKEGRTVPWKDAKARLGTQTAWCVLFQMVGVSVRRNRQGNEAMEHWEYLTITFDNELISYSKIY